MRVLHLKYVTLKQQPIVLSLKIYFHRLSLIFVEDQFVSRYSFKFAISSVISSKLDVSRPCSFASTVRGRRLYLFRMSFRICFFFSCSSNSFILKCVGYIDIERKQMRKIESAYIWYLYEFFGNTQSW